MEEHRNRTVSQRTEDGRDLAGSSALAASRPSGEHQQIQVLRDLPRPRAITPINLGFAYPEPYSADTPTSAPFHPQAQSQTARSSRAAHVPVPVLKNDPRRPGPNGANSKALPPPPGKPLERESSQTSTGSSISKLDKIDKSSSEWEILSEAGSRLNEGEVVNVDELQKKVDKRRSNYQYLESELAALDAQLKAAEERLARAKEQGIVLPGEAGTNENDARE